MTAAIKGTFTATMTVIIITVRKAAMIVAKTVTVIVAVTVPIAVTGSVKVFD